MVYGGKKARLAAEEAARQAAIAQHAMMVAQSEAAHGRATGTVAQQALASAQAAGLAHQAAVVRQSNLSGNPALAARSANVVTNAVAAHSAQINTPYQPEKTQPHVVHVPQDPDGGSIDPTPQSTGGSAAQPSPPPAPPPPTTRTVKIAQPDLILFDAESVDAEILQDLIFEDIGGIELATVERSDTINGERVLYNVISDLTRVYSEFNPLNILEDTLFNNAYVNQFQINLSNRLTPFTTGVYDFFSNPVIQITAVGTSGTTIPAGDPVPLTIDIGDQIKPIVGDFVNITNFSSPASLVALNGKRTIVSIQEPNIYYIDNPNTSLGIDYDDSFPNPQPSAQFITANLIIGPAYFIEKNTQYFLQNPNDEILCDNEYAFVPPDYIFLYVNDDPPTNSDQVLVFDFDSLETGEQIEVQFLVGGELYSIGAGNDIIGGEC